MLRVGNIERLQLESVGWSRVRQGPQRMEGSAGKKRPGACNFLPAMEGKITSLHWTRYTGGMMLVWQTHLTGNLEAVLLPLTCPTLLNIVSVFQLINLIVPSSTGWSAGSDFSVLYSWYFDFLAPARALFLPSHMPHQTASQHSVLGLLGLWRPFNTTVFERFFSL